MAGSRGLPSLYLLLLAATLTAAPRPAVADCAAFADQSIRWIVPSKPGGSFDAYSRLLQPFLEDALDARLVIDNRPEAGGLVAAMAIRDAAADGNTIGIVNAPGQLTARLVGNGRVPDLRTDFTILGRVVASDYAIFAGAGAGIASIDALLERAGAGPILVGVRDAGSSNFLTVPIAASLLGLDTALVTGYVGNASRTMAAIRGEVDIVIHSVVSARRYVVAGELVPLLQLTGPDADNLFAVPVLGGNDGLARQRATATGRSDEQAMRDARSLAEIIGSGRLVVAPAGLPEPLAACLGDTLIRTLRSEPFLAAARRAALKIDAADRETAKQNLVNAARQLHRFEPLLKAAIEQIRQ